jgi:hypothetical protein
MACRASIRPAEPVAVDLAAIPDVDLSIHSAPLGEIYFDTFQSGPHRIVPLDKASRQLIHDLRDAIPPIYNPLFESVADADAWLSDDDIVLGYADGDRAFAYAIRILNWHEMVSHEVNGRPILATY